MSYTPINWQNGDTITAEKMNKMDNGWSYTAGSAQQLFSETVTTVDDGDLAVGELVYPTEIPDGQVAVTFDGITYECTCVEGEIGDDTFSDYPFYVVFSFKAGINLLMTETEGTYTIAVSAGAAATIETSTEFRAVVESLGAPTMMCVPGTTTYAEMNDARNAGRVMFIYHDHVAYFVSAFFGETGADMVTTAPTTGAAGSFGFDNDLVLMFYDN